MTSDSYITTNDRAYYTEDTSVPKFLTDISAPVPKCPDTSAPVPKCLGSEVSWHLCVMRVCYLLVYLRLICSHWIGTFVTHWYFWSNVFGHCFQMLNFLVGTRCGPMSSCLFVTSRSSIETAERIKLVLAWKLPFSYVTPCCKQNSVSCGGT